MKSLLQDLGHHKEVSRPVKPLSDEATATGIGVAVGILVMAIVCLAMKMA